MGHGHQWHKEARDEREWEALHETRVDRCKSMPIVEGAEEDSIDEVRDAKQVPDKKPITEAKSIVGGHARGNPRSGSRHGNVTQSGGPGEATRQEPFLIGHQESQANEAPAVKRDQKHCRNRKNQAAPAGDTQAQQKQQHGRQKTDSHSYRRFMRSADEHPIRGQPKDGAKPYKGANEKAQVSRVHAARTNRHHAVHENE